MSEQYTLKVEISNKFFIELNKEILTFDGSVRLIELMKFLKAEIGQNIYDWSLEKVQHCFKKFDQAQTQSRIQTQTHNQPNLKNTEKLLILEFILKLHHQWKPPYLESELCHCRHVNTDTVIEYIIDSCRKVEDVTTACQAGAQCGSCRPDTRALIDYLTGYL